MSWFVHNILYVMHAYSVHIIVMYTKDIDECKNGQHNCDVNANCSNTNGSFECTCSDGFFGNGTVCISKCVFTFKLSLTVNLSNHLYSCMQIAQIQFLVISGQIVTAVAASHLVKVMMLISVAVFLVMK